ncbi:MAG: hypothetical protein K6F77_00250 [Lachnospiraceae bacterium]|nr:hypothetical protein [Lachnospiraceae bacterium]
MKWKENVIFEKENEVVWVCLGKKKKRIEEDDLFIAKLMDEGVVDDTELLKKVTDETKGDDISSGFRLAQFVEDYGEYIAAGAKSAVFDI